MAEPILRLEGVGKEFSGVRVLKGIDLTVNSGEVLAVLGANGAGKSTLMKIIGGAHQPDGGRMFLQGIPLTVSCPSEARKNGIAVIYQELSLVPTLDAVSNVFLGRERQRARVLDKAAMAAEYLSVSEMLNFNIPGDVKVSRLSIAQQQMVEIMKAVSTDARIIIMDEPTASLTETEKDMLFEIVLRLKNQGKTILYISHMLDEIFKIADRIAVLRDGEIVNVCNTRDTDKDGVIAMMMGNTHTDQDRMIRQRRNYKDQPPVLEVRNLSMGKLLQQVSLTLHPGEILGIAGLVGSGRTELCMALFGAQRIDGGEVLVEGKKVVINSPKKAIRMGIGLVPEDRKNLGLIQIQESYKNATAVQLNRMSHRGWISRKKELAFMQDARERLRIKLSSLTVRVRNLSGGNQQKIVAAKWLDMDLKVILFDEPTKGIDVAAKEDIFRIAADFAQKGMGVVFISSDLDEVARLSDRVLVMHCGRIVKELEADAVNAAEIHYAALHG